MLRRELVILFLVSCLIFASVPTALCRSPVPVIYVAGDGSGDFNCDGIDDHVQINQALKFVAENPGYTTVHLKGPFTYVIDDTLLIGSNTILEGDSTAVIKLANHAGWPTMKPLIQQMSSLGNNNIVIRGFEVDVNYEGNSEITLGRGYYNIMYFTSCNNVKVYNMYMHDGMGDGLRINQGKNVQFYNNKVYKLGHDAMFAIGCENVEAWNNRITCRTNSALRIWNSNKVKLHDNVIDSFYHWSAGGPGIQIEKSAGIMDDIEIYNNTIHNTYGPGIWLFNYDTSPVTRDQGKNIHIHHNILYSTGANPSITWVGGVLGSGFNNTLIENNVFDGIYHAAVVHMYPNGNYPSAYSPKSGYTTIVRNNVVVNTQKRAKDPSGTGYAAINYLPETHTFVLENNCLYNNVGGNYINAKSTTDIYVNPLFADQKNHDYHLQSGAGRWDGIIWVKDRVSSPCIDAGYPSSAYSNEPEPNGNRINIGQDGNTIYASKSGYVPIPILPTADFSSKITSGPSPLSIQFTDLSKNAVSWKWNFGDGASSTQQNPMHTYSAAGNYTVTLTVSNTDGTDTKTKTNYIKVGTSTQTPVANFWGSPKSGNTPLNVAFTDISTGSPTAWNWNFGDGTYSTVKSPKHTYSTAGKYTVTLTAKNAAGSKSITKFIYIDVKTLKAPVAAFSASSTSGKAQLKVTFTDKSTGSPSSWKWSFGDGTSSTAKNPVHTYSKAGKYTVGLTVKNAKGSNTKTMSGYITVK
jgi:PKD repeat protein